jgi:uncharacterized protein (UPF0264 family)
MQLLVSVRSAEEVDAAIAGGADIIDAKEPANGPLGAVSAATLARLASRVPSGTQFSLALGDVTSAHQVLATIAQLQLPSRQATTYLKLGFAGVRTPELVSAIMAAALRSSALKRFPVSVVAVAYADAEGADALPAELILRLAAATGVAGVLVDTYMKEGPGLLDCWTLESLASWTSLAETSGLVAGAAGRLAAKDVATVAPCGVEVIGFRGAACEGGRSGVVSVDRVHLLRRCIDTVSWEEGRTAYSRR